MSGMFLEINTPQRHSVLVASVSDIIYIYYRYILPHSLLGVGEILVFTPYHVFPHPPLCHTAFHHGFTPRREIARCDYCLMQFCDSGQIIEWLLDHVVDLDINIHSCGRLQLSGTYRTDKNRSSQSCTCRGDAGNDTRLSIQ